MDAISSLVSTVFTADGRWPCGQDDFAVYGKPNLADVVAATAAAGANPTNGIAPNANAGNAGQSSVLNTESCPCPTQFIHTPAGVRFLSFSGPAQPI